MNFFKKTKSSLHSDRFSFMNQEEQSVFINHIKEYFRDKLNFKLDFSRGVIYGSNGMQYGLDNLAQIFHKGLTNERKKIVGDHFDKLFKAEEEEKEILRDRAKFDIIKKYLSVRLFPLDYVQQIGMDALVYRNDLEDVLTVLVLDLPSSIVNIKPAQLEKWNHNKEKLFSIGFNNTFANNPVTITKQEIDNNIFLWLLNSDNLFSTSYIYNLSKSSQLLGKFGSLFIIPNRHFVVIFPINDLTVVSVMNKLPYLATKMYAEGPGSITSNIYWYNNEKFTKIPYELKKNSLSMTPPDEFIDVLNKLPKRE